MNRRPPDWRAGALPVLSRTPCIGLGVIKLGKVRGSCDDQVLGLCQRAAGDARRAAGCEGESLSLVIFVILSWCQGFDFYSVLCSTYLVQVIIIIIIQIFILRTYPPQGCSTAHLLPPGHWAQYPTIFLSSLGSIQAHYVQPLGATGLINHLYPSQVPHLYSWVKRSNYSKVSCSRTQVPLLQPGFEPHILTTRPSEHKSDALNRSAHGTLHFYLLYFLSSDWKLFLIFLRER